MAGNLDRVDVLDVRLLSGMGNLKAFVDIQIAGAIEINDCAVMDGEHGLRALFPKKLGRDGKWKTIVTVNREDLMMSYREAILEAYDREFRKQGLKI